MREPSERNWSGSSLPEPQAATIEGAGHCGVTQAEVQCHIAAHGQAADVSLRDVQVDHEQAEVLDGLVLGIGGRVFGDIGGRVAPGGVGDHPVAAGEEVDLRVPTVVVAAELVTPDEGEPLPVLLVVKLDTVGIKPGHELLPSLIELYTKLHKPNFCNPTRGKCKTPRMKQIGVTGQARSLKFFGHSLHLGGNLVAVPPHR